VFMMYYTRLDVIESDMVKVRDRFVGIRELRGEGQQCNFPKLYPVQQMYTFDLLSGV